MTVEEVRGSLDLTDNGAIKNSIRNCLTVFQNDPVLQGAVRYNILTERIDIVKPLWWSKQTATLTDTDLNYLMLYGAEREHDRRHHQQSACAAHGGKAAGQGAGTPAQALQPGA